MLAICTARSRVSVGLGQGLGGFLNASCNRRVTTRGRVTMASSLVIPPERSRMVTCFVTPCRYFQSMPVYHFTFHAYGSWLPDRPEGYDPHGRGHQPQDPNAAEAYRDRMQQPQADLKQPIQQVALQALLDSQPLQYFDLYAFAAEPSHLHAVVAWGDDRDPVHIRSQVKSSLTRALNNRFGKRPWFVSKAGHTAVKDEAHLHQLVDLYLTKHQGLYWKLTGKPPGHARGATNST